jgi:hypothetical protein
MKNVYEDGFEDINTVQCWAAFVHETHFRYAIPNDNSCSGRPRKATDDAQALGVNYGQKYGFYCTGRPN